MQSEHFQMPIHVEMFSRAMHWDNFIMKQQQEVKP